jgi:glyoxylase I family protein
LPNGDQLELFSFPNSPSRPSYPESCGLRHLALSVEDLEKTIDYLKLKNVFCEPIRVDEFTGKRFTFFADPDHLPIELVEL